MIKEDLSRFKSQVEIAWCFIYWLKNWEVRFHLVLLFCVSMQKMDFVIIFSYMHTSALSSHLLLSYGPTSSLPLPKASLFSCHICVKFQTHPAQIAGRYLLLFFIYSSLMQCMPTKVSLSPLLPLPFSPPLYSPHPMSLKKKKNNRLPTGISGIWHNLQWD